MKVLTTAVIGSSLAALLSGVMAMPSSASAPAAKSHCVTNVAAGQTHCYDTFPQALSAATGGQITDAPQSPAAAAASRSFEQQINAIGRQAASSDAPLALVTLSIEYDWNYYQTTEGSITYVGPSGCDSDGSVEWQRSNLGDAWNDRISSFRGYNGCQVNHFQHANFEGARTGPLGSSFAMSEIGGVNNQASSIRWV
ncbi:hypothetical protein [Spirillospora sp. NPDC047279]|uniref:hypothetical protein n=1 Tax=Spirillospora sp. NPDC047279 TaxID=3155478 RepID=UPI0033CDD850